MTAYAEQLARILPTGLTGTVSNIIGLTATIADFPAPLGGVCRITPAHGRPVEAEVVGFRFGETLTVPYGNFNGVRRGDRVELVRSCIAVAAGDALRGRVLDGLGRAIDGGPPPLTSTRRMPDVPPVRALDRPPISEILGTGVRAIDAFLTCGRGQRLGIFAGSGVGKSTLLGQIARVSDADVNVVVLVGERGREVREFLERDLGPEGIAKSVIVVATGDEPALLRYRAAMTGTAIAEAFRDEGRDVLLVMDSVTRFALAQREIGLAAGEPPATRGYPPSVFAALPRLLERSGRTTRGSITALYTVLVEADDQNEPIADAVRGILDGHIVLSRRLAERAHWPAIDVPASLSRTMNGLVASEHRKAADDVRRLLAAHRDAEDLISLGAYQPGSDPLIDRALRLKESIAALVCQRPDEYAPPAETVAQLLRLETPPALRAASTSASPRTGAA
ncbi:MAG: FliI/YscN family ATPase [Planctomycetota bacterium]|nr:FliI/YscN family ATPase [Planctomycetaceae bacterium]MDQ3330528.1 FliI/YscN family ATPase [Planctomycetota bacterium]